MAIALGLTINLIQAIETCRLQFTIDVFCSRTELGKDNDLFTLYTLILRENAFQFTDFIILAGIEVHNIFNELSQHFHVQNGIVQHSPDIKIFSTEVFFSFPNIIWEVILQFLKCRLHIILYEVFYILQNICLVVKGSLN